VRMLRAKSSSHIRVGGASRYGEDSHGADSRIGS